jgi:hypothetical protein
MTVDDWRRMIFEAEGLSDWRVEEGESYCYHDTKTIKLFAHDQSPASFLHEVAHVFSPEPEGTHKNHFHGGLWFSQFHRLVDKYMVTRVATMDTNQ